MDDLVVGMGGNVGGELAIRERFERARAALGEHVIASAPLYRTAAIRLPDSERAPGELDEPIAAHLNTALRVRISDVPPDELLARLHAIERDLGRDRAREIRWGARPIDLD